MSKHSGTAGPDALGVVYASPAAVAAHDKEAWLGLFARDHVVEDPVGGRPVIGGVFDRRTGERGYGPLGRFWETFIAPNDIVVSDGGDVVDDLAVARDVTIETRMSTGVVLRTPAHLVYELTHEDGGLRIRRLAAHWEVGPMLRQLVRPSTAHVSAMAEQAARSMRIQGLGGAAAFVRSVHSVGNRGKAATMELVGAARNGDAEALKLLGGAVPSDLRGLIAAGDTVTGSCTVDGAAAMLVCHLNRKSLRITRCALYVDRR